MKRAILIGINEYKYFNALEGCENDARSVDELLRERFGFEQTRLLLNADATRANILGAFDQMVTDTQRDDIALVYYAGHGSQIRDREGDEPSGFDSTLIPVDSARDDAHPEMMREITDDEIFLFLQKLGNKTTTITVIVDACHSGTITRDASAPPGLGRVRGVPADTRAPTTPSPIPEELWPMLRGESGAGMSSGGWLPVRDHYVMLSGCRDAELSGELSLSYDDGTKVNHGALTYYLLQALESVQPGATYRSVFESVAPKVTTFRQGTQHPQMEGRIDRELFGMKEIPPMRYVRVATVANDGNTITVAAGAAMGFTPGTVIALYEAGTVNTEGQTPLAIADVTTVRPLDSSAAVRVEGRTGEISQSTRAVVQSVGLTDPRRTVQVIAAESADVSADAITKMQSAISRSTILRLVETPTLDTLTVRVWPSSVAQNASRWAVTGTDATPVAPLKAISDTATVVNNLEILARQALALALENGDSNSALGRARPTVQLLYRYGKEPFQVATPSAGGLPEFEEAVQIGVRVTNPHSTPVYLSLLDFGLSGKVTPMYPPKGAHEALAAGASVDLLVRDGEQWEFWLPEIYPYVADGPLPVRDDGVETIKLFATSSPANFEFLEEATGVRSAGSVSEIESFFRERVGKVQSAATREGRPVAAAPAPVLEDWTTVLAPFVMRRKGTARMPSNITRLLATERCVVQQSVPVTQPAPGAVAETALTIPSPNAGFGQLLLSVTTDGSVIWQLPEHSESGAIIQRYMVRPAPTGTAVHARAAFVFPLDATGSIAPSTIAALDTLQASSSQARLPQGRLPQAPTSQPLQSLTGRN